GIRRKHPAGQIDRRNRCKSVSVSAARSAIGSRCSLGEITKDALPGSVCEDGGNHILFLDVALFINEDKKESLVLLDWTAQSPTELIPVRICFRSTNKILEPSLGGERGVPVGVKQCAMKIIAARARLDLHLGRTSSGGGIDAVDDNLDFFDEIG